MKLLILLVLIGIFCDVHPKVLRRVHRQRFQPRVSTGKHWAVLVAGSNGYYNYRHQSDVCHAYQVVHRNGIPEDQIITMLFDDIAYSRSNPTPGVLINHPNGSNVYKGVIKDYTKMDVTPEMFLAVLKGDKNATKGRKVVESGPDDHIFVNLVDHGAPGIFAFPRNELHAQDLLAVIKEMNNAKKFKQMVIYVEACESGSLFQDLPKNVNVYATTAANAIEPSYTCYYDAYRGTFLGDVYSVKWMEDSDKEDLTRETIQKQYQIVKREVNTSHVKEFGDISVSDNAVDVFEGNDDKLLRFIGTPLPSVPLNAVPSEHATISILEKMGNMEELARVKREHETISCQMHKIVNLSSRSNGDANRYMTTRTDHIRYNCYRPVAEKYLRTCRNSPLGQDGYHLRQMFALVNMCYDFVAPDTIMAAIDHVCGADGAMYCRA